MAYMKDATGRRLDAMTVVAAPNTRTSYLTLAAPLSTQAASAINFSFRTMARLPLATGRWRIGFANRNLRSATLLTTPCTITGVYVGSPVYGTTSASGARWTGAATGALSQVSTTITVPTDGSVGWSDWITGTDDQFEPFVEKVIGWGQTTIATGNGWGTSSASYQMYYASGSANAGNATLTSPTLSTLAYLDIIVEYEFTTPAQVGLFIGDSNTFGVATSAPELFQASGVGTLPCEAWPAVAGEVANFSAINFGVGSATLADFATVFPGLWTRVDLAAIDIDFAVVSLGTNGLSSNDANFTSDVGRIRAIDTQLRALGIKRIYWTDITPRGYTASASTLSAAMTAGATTFQTATTLSFNDGQSQVIIGAGATAEYLTVTSTTPTGSGPYTYTLTAGCANAHAAGQLVTAGTEAARRRLNAFLRNLPDGISGCIGFEQAFEAAPLSATADPRLVCADGLHFVRGAGMQRAALAAVAGVAPLLRTS